MANQIERLLELSQKVNIAPDLDQEVLDDMGQRVVKGYNDDDGTRDDWKKKNKDYIDLAMQVKKDKTFPWPNSANVKFPSLTIAAIQFAARAYPALVPGKDIVKGKVTGYDPTGEKQKTAERVGKHMSYQLSEDMTEWEDDMDRGLLVLPITGSFFKKTYFDSLLDRNVSKAVWSQDVVINYKTPSIERAPRVSEEFELYPQEIKERMNGGTWLDIDIQYQNEEEDDPEKFIEQHTTWDIDKDGYKEPYVITVHKESSQVVRVVARYDEESLFFMEGDTPISVGARNREIEAENAEIAESNMQAVLLAQKAHDDTDEWEDPIQVPPKPVFDFTGIKIFKIEAINYYTQYIFFPSIDGGIYGMGFGQLLEALSEAINSLINQSLDAATLANLGGGFKAKGAKVPAGTQIVGTGEWIDVETNGMPLKDSLLPFTFRGPSAASFNLLDLLLSSVKDISGTQDILMGDSSPGATATTTMIIREEGMRVYTAIYKRIFRAMKDELSKLYALNRKYLPDETYFMVLDNAEAIRRDDYSYDETDVQPVADPTIATASQRAMKAEVGLKFVGDPDFDSKKLKRNFLEAFDYPDIDGVMPEQEGPDPAMQMALEKAKAELDKLKADTGKIYTEMIKNIADAEATEIGPQLDQYKQQMDAILGGGNVDQGTGGGMAQPSDNQADLTGLVGAGAGAGTELGPGGVPTG